MEKKSVEKKKKTTTTKKSSTKKSSTKKTVKTKSASLEKNTSKVVKKKSGYVRNSYYMFKMNTLVLNGFSLLLILISCILFCLLYGSKALETLNDNIVMVILLYLPYMILHEVLHSLAYVIYGADFKNITYGVHLEKGVLCCLCKQNIDKRNILHSLLYPFIIIGIMTLVIGVLINSPLLVILSLTNISGCSGDLVMYYHLSKLNNYSFSEYNDPIAFGLYTKEDFSNLKMFGLDYVDKKTSLERNDLRKIVISKTSIIILILFYALILFDMVA